ncbi:MAG: hypothetical protein ASARMPRED_001179 [Alectoria sarmentosa]|nr:MAG: hypothetical protein ASARMPRED_001179 [Alectoria sarmentosa]
MAKTSALESLAPELQLQILVNADTPDDLHALIQASSRLYQVYLLNKEAVLSGVACRQFHPAVISDALFFAKISQLEQPLPRDTVIELCKSYPGERHEETTIPIPMSVALCKLASNVRFFIEDYARNTLPIMEGLGRSLDLDVLTEYGPETFVYSKPSETEIGRLQRAFCRFEIYRHLFARCSSVLDHDLQGCSMDPSLTPAKQASLFLEKFPDFQVEEITCIRDYIFRRLRGICSRLEDKAVDTLPPETLIFDHYDDVERAEWASGVWLFTSSGKAYQNDHLEHLMSLGLSYLRRIFESTGEEHQDLFIRFIYPGLIRHLEKRFITTAIEALGRNPARGDTPLLAKTDPPFQYEVRTDVELDIPDAWQWAHPRAPPLMLNEGAYKGLRDWGYVFWDLDRLRESGILERDRNDVRKIKFDEFEAADGPSVQERLLGPPAPFSYSEDDSDGS